MHSSRLLLLKGLVQGHKEGVSSQKQDIHSLNLLYWTT